MLLHGWMASADLNWGVLYDDLVRRAIGCWRSITAATAAGCGRWPRSGSSIAPPTPPACSATLEATPALVVGYSMGGAIAQLMAREHPEVVEGVVLSGTAQHWQDRRTRCGLPRTRNARPELEAGPALHLGRRPAPDAPA